MTTREQLWANICQNPANDTARGAYADWCDENGDPDHASLIRVQLELAAIGDFDFTERNKELGHRCYADTERERLRARSDALLTLVEPRLRRGAACGLCGGKGGNGLTAKNPDDLDGEGWTCANCGQPSSLQGHTRGPGAEFYCEPLTCPNCSGTGWAGVLAEQVGASTNALAIGGVYDSWLIRARWSRGFVSSITCPLAWWMQHGRQACREWPITEIETTTHQPWQNIRREWVVGGDDGTMSLDGRPKEWIPWDVYRDDLQASFPTEPAARAALSAALLTWSRNPEPAPNP